MRFRVLGLLHIPFHGSCGPHLAVDGDWADHMGLGKGLGFRVTTYNWAPSRGVNQDEEGAGVRVLGSW